MDTFFVFVRDHFIIAIPMFLMSFTGIGLLVWRILLNVNGTTNLNSFIPVLTEKLSKEGVSGALKYCRSRSDIIPRQLFVPGLETAKQGTAAQKRAMANAIELEIMPDLNFLLAPILAIAKVATMVGLLGTVISMIGTFTAIQKAKGGDVTSSAGDIGLALWATALGLVTAIPLAFSHVLLKAWLARFEVRMKSAAAKLLIMLQSASQSGRTAAVPADSGAAKAMTGTEATARR